MRDPRCSFGACYVEGSDGIGRLVVCGGWVNGEQTDRCEIYHTIDKKWKQLPKLNEQKSCSTVSILGKRHLVCCGGFLKSTGGNRGDGTEKIEVLTIADEYT